MVEYKTVENEKAEVDFDRSPWQREMWDSIALKCQIIITTWKQKTKQRRQLETKL